MSMQDGSGCAPGEDALGGAQGGKPEEAPPGSDCVVAQVGGTHIPEYNMHAHAL